MEKFKIRKFKFATGILLALLVLLPVRYTLERGKFFESSKEVQAFYKMNEVELALLNENAIVFGTDDYIEVMYHTDVYAAYRQLPNKDELERLEKEGFTLYLLEEDNLRPMNRAVLLRGQ